MRKFKVGCVLLVMLSFTVNAKSQQDSLKNALLRHYDKAPIFDKVFNELKAKGIEDIITFVVYSNFGYAGVILWNVRGRPKEKSRGRFNCNNFRKPQ